MARSAVLDRLQRAWDSLSSRGVPERNRAEARAVMGANNFYLLTGLVNIPWAFVIMSHNQWSYPLPGITHLAMIMVWAAAFLINARGYTPWASVVSLLAAVAQFTLLADTFSRGAGFHLALAVVPSLTFVMLTPRNWVMRTVVSATALGFGMWVYLGATFTNPSIEVTDAWRGWSGAMMMTSIVSMLVTLSLFSEHYLNRERGRNRELLAEAQIAAQTDALTHLSNRRGVSPRLQEAADTGPYSLAIADLDRFKRVNDVLGHGAGDIVLAEVARTLVQSIGDAGAVARWGGEEFLIVLPAVSLSQAEAIMDRARIDLEKRFRDDQASVTMSVGVVYAPRYSHRDDVLRLADTKLYEAKASGRNVVVAASLDDGESAALPTVGN
jgi:diguanylate cyclase (GGDEF)-like protein